MGGVRTVEQRWEQFHRHGPNALLGIGALMAALSADLIGMSGADRYTTAGLLVAASALQLWWGRARSRAPARGTAARSYYVLRTLIAFALCWYNPFFSVFAISGYFDIVELVPGRFVRAGLFCTAVTMAGSQSGSGMPPASLTNWAAFGALLVLHFSLALLFGNISARETERTERQTATITELERANNRLEQALSENAALHAQLLLQAREAGVADERRRLAAEIHDTLAQGLTGIIAQLQAVTSTEDPAQAREHLDRAAGLARHSLGEARRSVHDLVPAALVHDDLPGALKKTVTGWAERTGVRADLTVTGTVEPLHDEVGATLLRIAEEALANTARHAGAARAGVTLSYMGDEVTLDIRDDGCGFDPAALPPRSGTGGFGLGGMRARAERIAGTAEIETEPGQGTAVSARVPLVRRN
ncbi:sensor histidine kinase [Streptomyces sp. NBC_01460]|uniref:sensor histidine kinase n=1 Tax=Streptomyces sp. NBC_01460 TaxID=2903875 RepID=UPI002E32E5F4|nr:sensor histidine kinase [Streptomyces sp. NBC_01460]